MKIRIIMLIAAIVFSSESIYANNGKTKVPQAVVDAFNKKYPKATDVEWEKDKLNYEVEFELGEIEYEATFSEDGTWLETETEIEEKDFPENVAAAFKAAHPKAKIKEIQKVETPKSTFYEIEYKKGMKKKEAFFDSEGKQLQIDED